MQNIISVGWQPPAFQLKSKDLKADIYLLYYYIYYFEWLIPIIRSLQKQNLNNPNLFAFLALNIIILKVQVIVTSSTKCTISYSSMSNVCSSLWHPFCSFVLLSNVCSSLCHPFCESKSVLICLEYVVIVKYISFYNTWVIHT